MPDVHERFHQFLYAIIIVQFVLIIVLLSGLSNEYLNNDYMKAWINNNAPLLGILLHGELDTAFVGAAIGLTFLLIQRRHDASKKPASAKSPTSTLPTFNNPTTQNTKTATVPAQTNPDSNPGPAAKSQEKPPAEEVPEHILAELEKTDP